MLQFGFCHKNTDFLINQKTGYISIFLHNYTCSPLCLKVHSGEDDFSQQVNEINKHLKKNLYIWLQLIIFILYICISIHIYVYTYVDLN